MKDVLGGWSVPPLPPDLRARVLEAAESAARAAADRRPLHWIDRLYEDLALRRAALAAAFCLTALVLATLPGETVARLLEVATTSPPAVGSAIVEDESTLPDRDPGTSAASQRIALAVELAPAPGHRAGEPGVAREQR